MDKATGTKPSTRPLSRFPLAWPAALAGLALATLGTFAGVLRNGWILYDDPIYVYENPLVQYGWRWRNALALLHTPHGGNWHPLTSWSHLLDVQIFGLNPAGPHGVNLALHVINALLVAEVLRRLTGARWRSWIIAALFALHPLRVESVAWVSERKDVLSGLFFLLTIAAYQAWTQRSTRGRWIVVHVLFALGLMAKPMLVSLPLVLLLLDVWPLRRVPGTPFGRLVREKTSLFLMSLACAIVTFLVQKQTGAVAPLSMLSPVGRVTNALVSFWRYIGASLWPRGLAPYYPYRVLSIATVALAAAGLVAASVLAWRARKRAAWWTMGWFWFVIMLLPVIGLVQVGSQAWADRYSYLPMLGLTIAVVWSLADWLGRNSAGRALGGTAVAAACIALAVSTHQQVARWKDTRTLFAYTLQVTGENAIAEQNLGNALLQAGDLNGAMLHLREALRLRPAFPDARNNLGSLLGAMGHVDEAIENFEYALRYVPTPSLHENLGHAYALKGRLDDAIREYQAALRLDPDRPTARVRLAGALLDRGRPAEAEPQLEAALVARPNDLEVHRRLAVSLIQQGRVEEAIKQYRAVLARSATDPDALVNIAWIRATHAEAAHRNGAEALEMARRARAGASGGEAAVLSTLAAAYAENRLFARAVATADSAIAAAAADKDTAAGTRFRAQREAYRAGTPYHFHP